MKKKLLKESEVRKLMKFANIGALSDNFVSRITEADMMEPEEDELAADAGGEVEGDMSPEPDVAPEEPLPEDPEMEGEGLGAGDELAEKVEDLVAKLDDVLTAANPELAGMVSSQRGDEDDGLDVDAPVDEPVEEPAGVEEPPMPAAGPEEEEPPEDVVAEEADLEEADLEEDMVNEVARRVARRLKRLRRK